MTSVTIVRFSPDPAAAGPDSAFSHFFVMRRVARWAVPADLVAPDARIIVSADGSRATIAWSGEGHLYYREVDAAGEWSSARDLDLTQISLAEAWDAAMARRLMAEEHGVVPTTGLSGFAALCDAFAAHTTGRDATLHALGERVREGDLERSEALEMLRDREPAWPDDRHPWLDRLGLDDTGLQRLADTFRDPALWWRDRGRWNRHQPWETAAVARVA